MTQILVFGDSIAYGAWDGEGGWVQRLRRFLDKKTLDESNDFYCLVYNLGVSGEGTKDLLVRFESEIKPRLIEGEETIIIIAIGINDSVFIHSKNDLNIPEQEFKNNIQKLIEIAKKYSSNIIFVGLTPVDEDKTDPIPWVPNESCKNEYIMNYNSVIKEVCEEKKIYFIDLFNEFVKENYKNLLEDGLHPNSKGHKKIFGIIRDFLVENLQKFL